MAQVVSTPGGGLDTVIEMFTPADGSILANTTTLHLWYTDSSRSKWKFQGNIEEDTKFVLDSINYYILKIQSYSVIKSRWEKMGVWCYTE